MLAPMTMQSPISPDSGSTSSNMATSMIAAITRNQGFGTQAGYCGPIAWVRSALWMNRTYFPAGQARRVVSAFGRCAEFQVLWQRRIRSRRAWTANRVGSGNGG